MANDFKNMQEKNPHDVRCGKCSEVIVPASETKNFTDDDLLQKTREHKCPE